MRKIYQTLVVALLVAIVCGVGYVIWLWRSEPAPERVKMTEARITDLRPMAELCTVDFVEDVPIKARIGKKHIFARTTLKGSISFDMEGVTPEYSGDTIRVRLPKEKIEILESTAPDSYEVIDTWNESLFGSGRFSTAEENAVKAKVKDNYRKGLYRRGYVSRAQKEARENLKGMLGALTGKTVIVE